MAVSAQTIDVLGHYATPGAKASDPHAELAGLSPQSES